MGRNRKQGGRGRGGGGGRGRGGKPDEWNQDKGVRGGYKVVVKENENFEAFYKAQGIVPEEEWDEFIAKMKEPLPATFRITGNRSQAKEVLKKVEGEYLNKLMDMRIEDEEEGIVLDPPKCLPWYPDNLAWQLNTSRKFIRHNDTLKKLHNFLVSETESGNISRQEAVSMIPPLVLDIQPHHKVLDMCAAPGSKTTQLIEYLHNGIDMPEGFVVANDSDNKRCYLMVHQVKRLESPCFVIVNHDASQMPSFRLNPEDEKERVTLRYDRVLADVPCSGDGTMRKNPDVWGKWNAGGGNNLHHLQLRILRRGLEMLEVGGRLVYSTCSLNPTEDESVLASMLQECQGAVELLEVSDRLPGLKYTRGKSTWKVYSRFNETFETFEDVPEKLQTQIRPSMFPPTAEEAEKLHLEKCLRILPHHQNTGGFFIAALTKKAELPWMKAAKKQDKVVEAEKEVKDEEATEKESAEVAETDAAKEDNAEENGSGDGNGDDNGKKRKNYERTGSPPPYKKQRFHGYKEDPFIFLEKDDAFWPPIQKFLGMSENFPVEQLLVRCNTGKRRHVYFTSPAIRNLVKYNENKVRFVNLGLKVLSRSEGKYCDCDYRLVQEGVHLLLPHINSRKMNLPAADVVTLLTTENPFLTKFTDSTEKNLKALKDAGSLVFLYTPDPESEEDPKCSLVISGWLGRTSCRSFLQKNDRAHILRLFGKEIMTKEEIEEELDRKAAAAATKQLADANARDAKEAELYGITPPVSKDTSKPPQDNHDNDKGEDTKAMDCTDDDKAEKDSTENKAQTEEANEAVAEVKETTKSSE